MTVERFRTELAAALQTEGDNSFVVSLSLGQQLEEVRGTPDSFDVVVKGPPSSSGPGATWGRLIASAVTRQAAQQHTPAFLAFERAGGYWHILELLSDARELEPVRRQQFYVQFQDEALNVAMLAGVGHRGQCDQELRRCMRNLARCPGIRLPLGPAIPTLIADFEDDALVGVSAAALCNIACCSQNKERAVDGGALRSLVYKLDSSLLPALAAEDVTACIGVLVGSFEKGIAALFELAVADGRHRVFDPFFVRLQVQSLPSAETSPKVQCLLLDILHGLCAASPQFRDWIIQETPVVKAHLPKLLGSEEAPVRRCALEFAGFLVDGEGFIQVFQAAGGLTALQALIETGPGGPQIMAAAGPRAGRREPSERELVQFLLSKILVL